MDGPAPRHGVDLLPRGRRGWRAFLLRWLVIVLVAAAGGVSVFKMPGRSYDLPLNPLTAEEAALRDRLRLHVKMLAGEIGERNVWRYDALQASCTYLAQELRTSGLDVDEQVFTAGGKPVRNLEAELAGATKPAEIVVVGAHYDSVHGSPRRTTTAAVRQPS